MRIKQLVVLVPIAVLVAVVPQSSLADNEKDGVLNGTWVLTSAVVDGVKTSATLIKKENHRRTFTDNKLEIQRDDLSVPITATFELDIAKGTIDITPNEGPDKGKVVPGIFDIKGDTLRMCVVDPGNPRPKEFSSKVGTGRILTEFKRKKTAKPK